jgi:ankyrin repeat protein
MKKIFLILFSLSLFFNAPLKAESNNQDLNELLFNSISSDTEIDLEKIENYLKAGANPNWVNKKHKREQSVLDNFLWKGLASNNPRIIEAIKLLIKYGAKATDSDSTLFWSMALNSYFDTYELTKLLLDNGASAITWSYSSIGTELSPIEFALKEGHNELAELLVEYGATMPDKKIFIQEQFINAISELGNNFNGGFEELSGYLEDGAKINGANKDGKIALVQAIESLSYYWLPEVYLISTIEFLLNNGADPNQLGAYSFSSDKVAALHTLSWFSQFETVSFELRFKPVYELLLSNGAHISKRSEHQMTPLHYAAIENNVDATKYLLLNYSKVSPKDKFGKTPLDYAESGEVIKLLKQYGATE